MRTGGASPAADSPLSSALRAWDRFWFAPGGTLSLGLFRILFTWALLEEVETSFHKSVFAVEGGFHLSYLDVIGPVSWPTYVWLHEIQYSLIIGLGLGLSSRLFGGLLVLVHGYLFFADPLNFRNHPYFFLLVLLLLACSPADDALSLRTLARVLWNRRRGDGERSFARLLGSTAPMTVQRLIQVEVCIVYFYAGLHKLNAGFLGGDVMSHYFAQDLAGGDVRERFAWVLGERLVVGLQELVAEPSHLIPFAVLSAVLELVLPITLWMRRTRLPSIALGVLFHVLIFLTMDIFAFSVAMIGTYVLFLDPETLPRLAGGAARRLAARRGLEWQGDSAAATASAERPRGAGETSGG